MLLRPSNGEMLDDGVVVWLPGPKTATGEDMVELHTHGGRAVVAGVASALAELCRPAAAGEFTRRAFANGVLDLVQVEGVADLLNADTESQRRAALRSLDGSASAIYEHWRARLSRALAHVEAVIDFGEDDLASVDADVLASSMASVDDARRAIEVHLDDGGRGEILRDGVAVAIVGAPNAGKSSLLNALARRPASIVSHIAGTTRDVVEVRCDFGGVPVILADTAGIRGGVANEIEAEGISRALSAARNAQVIVCVVDVRSASARSDSGVDHSNLLPAEVLDVVANLRCSRAGFLVLNKCDDVTGAASIGRTHEHTPLSLHPTAAENGPPTPQDLLELGLPVHRVSCATGAGIDAFVRALEAHVQSAYGATPVVRPRQMTRGFAPSCTAVAQADGVAESSDVLETQLDDTPGVENDAQPIIARARHRHHLVLCCASLSDFLNRRGSIDMAAEDLRVAVRALGAITGAVGVEEILDSIFADFCIGK